MMRSGNPVLRADVFLREGVVSPDQAMTVQGTVNKTGISVLITTAAAMFVCSWMVSGRADSAKLGK